MAPSKIVVIGDINGQFESVLQKLGALHAKQNFAFALIAGNLFSNPDSTTNEDVEHVTKLINGQIKVPLTTYFALGSHPFPEKVLFKLEQSDGELCPNLFFLGKRTTTKTSEGIKIVSLGGVFDPHVKEVTKDITSGTYSEADAKSLKGNNHADILITSEWPDGIRKGSKVDFPAGQNIQYREFVSELSVALKPRYHFSASPTNFYEREPFFHPNISEAQSDTFSITRFISLAAFGNTDKKKWIYAFSLDPTAAAPISLPAGTTTSPLTVATKKRGPTSNSQPYRYSDETWTESRPKKRRKGARPPPGPGDCFFCLSNPNIAQHLITSIGNDSYLTTAKGPLTTNTTFSSLDFPAHILIIPLMHTPALGLIQDEESQSATYKEMQLYRKALNSMLKAKSSELGSITWEISRAEGVHVHWQWLPISLSLIQNGLVDAAFRVEAENQKYPSFENRTVEDGETEDYFRVLIWDSKTGKDTSLVLPLDSSVRFSVQFGRQVLAKLLEVDSRMDWKNCGQSIEDEEKDANQFKEAFKEFDFSLDD